MVVTGSSAFLQSRWYGIAFLGVSVLLGSVVGAEERGVREIAASHFDAGVEHFERGELEKAARAFLAADVAVSSMDALMNALASARKARSHLMMVDAAQRILRHPDATEEQRIEARRARLEAAPYLTLLRASCQPSPCQLELDGKPWTVDQPLVLPGLRRLRAVGPDGVSRAEWIKLEAGTAYDVSLELEMLESEVHPADLPTPPSSQKASTDSVVRGGISPTWTYVGMTMSGALLLVTTWSGIDTLRAKSNLSDRPSQSEIDDMERRIQRTDLLLGGTLVLGSVTALVAWQWTAWEEPIEVGVVMESGGRGGAMMWGSF